jgi:WD40-like Beta Propeller Repeat
MSQYGQLERSIAKALDSFPGVRSKLRKTYQKISYIRHKEKNFQYSLMSGLSLEKPINSEREYFFGYYDRSPWSTDMQYYVLHSIKNNEEIEISLIDLTNNTNKVIDTSLSWNFQQGSMIQWFKDKNQIIYNTIKEQRLVATIYNVDEEVGTDIPYPIQTLCPDGTKYLSINYKRLDILRPEYGYRPKVTNYSGVEPLEQDGIFEIEIQSKKAELIISFSRLIHNSRRPEMEDSDHKINHVVYSPNGSKFIFMHRWIGPNGKFSRLYVSDSSGNQLKILLDDRMVSHYHWRDENHIIVWGRKDDIGDRYYLINVNTGELKILGKNKLEASGDGHPSFSPDGRWMITDTYPDKSRQRHLILYDSKNDKLFKLGRFFAPWSFDEEVRCDLHPRWSPDGKKISIDSAHEGYRKNYMIDLSTLIKG